MTSMKYTVIASMIYGMLLFPCFSFESNQEMTRDTKEILYACGYNSLYLFLKLQGVNVSMDEVKSQVNIGESGTSFYDLKTASGCLGITSQTIECSYPKLQKFSFPVIAWVSKNYSKNDVSKPIIGHFIVIISCIPNEVIYIDGTTGQSTKVKSTTFIEQWNGMLLVSESQLKNQSPKYILDTGMVIFTIGVLCFGIQFFKKKKSVSAIIIIFFSLCTFVNASETTQNRIWRTHENGATNGLHLLLRSHGITCNYHMLNKEMQSIPNKNMNIIRAEAQKRGLLSDIYFCQSVSALEKFSLPFLIHTGMGSEKESSLWNGNFLLVIGRGKQHFMAIDCGTVQLSEITEENLRRYWSGYVLAKTPERKTSFVFSP
ncbi:MAG: hypothetical protein LBJ67_09050, partial [Planctomycetaceae bacterium]|nr:hypothetical protein [Planctomycetaceae bacterium]